MEYYKSPGACSALLSPAHDVCKQNQLLAALNDLTTTAGTTAYETNGLIATTEAGLESIAGTLINGAPHGTGDRHLHVHESW